MPRQKLKQSSKISRALVAVALLFFVPWSFAQTVTPKQVEVCVACHGVAGNSQIGQFPSLAGQPRVFLENQLVLIREGLRDIPSMKGMLAGLKDQDLISMAKYFAAQKPVRAESLPVKPDVFERGKTISRAMLCGTCHLPDYSGREQIPRLAGQQEEFLVYSMKQFRDHAGPGRDTIMSASLFGLKDDELADMAHFLSNFKQ